MRNPKLQGAILSIIVFVCGLITWIHRLNQEGFANMHWWFKIAYPFGLICGAALCWLMCKAYIQSLAKPPENH